MSDENVEVARRIYDGWSRGDFTRIDLFHPEIAFEMVDWPHQTHARGIEDMWRT
jgi:hypothetical protein